jgi:hypothetical protein
MLHKVFFASDLPAEVPPFCARRVPGIHCQRTADGQMSSAELGTFLRRADALVFGFMIQWRNGDGSEYFATLGRDVVLRVPAHGHHIMPVSPQVRGAEEL